MPLEPEPTVEAYVESLVAVFREVRRVLNEGDRLLIVEFEKHNKEALRTNYGDRWLGFDRDEIIEWLRGSGFILNKTECIGVNMGLTLCIYDATRT